MTTKIHAVCASEADAVDIRITAGQVGDAPVGEALVEPLDPREGIRHAAMDKAYDSNAIRAKLDAKGITPVIPPKSNRLEIVVTTRNATSSATRSSAFLTNSSSSAESLPAMKNSKPTSWLSSPSPSS